MNSASNLFLLVDQKELKAMYKQFKKESPEGTIGKEEFKDVMQQMGVVDEFLQNLIFNVFDDNKDNTINFQEFVTALSVMTRGDPQEKLECTTIFQQN
jgi:Ca2+-binding EF-hand superfamily protein